MISLFSERPQPSQRPTSFLVSIFAHAGAVALLSFGIIYTPEFRDPVMTRKYTVRHLDLHTSKEQQRQSTGKGFAYPGAHSKRYFGRLPMPKRVHRRWFNRIFPMQ